MKEYRFAVEVPVIGYVQAPFRHASMLRGSENIMRDMYNQKENLRKLCEIPLSSLIVYAVALISAGDGLISYNFAVSNMVLMSVFWALCFVRVF